MKYEITFQLYKNEFPVFNDYTNRIVDDENYFKTIDEVIEYIQLLEYTKIEQYLKLKNDIQKSIDNHKVLPVLVDDYKLAVDLKNILNNMPDDVAKKLQKDFEPLDAVHVKNLHKNDAFIKNNVIEVFKIIDGFIIELQNKIKHAQKEAHKRYYQKMKALKNTIPKENKTEEEKIELKKISNKEYYEKTKQLKEKQPKTEEQIISSQKQAQKKYYEKMKALKNTIPKEPKTAEQILESRKIAQKKYNEKVKEKLRLYKENLKQEKIEMDL